MDKEKIKIILDEHEKWVLNQEDGEQADLRGVNLRGVGLYGTDLYRANLCEAILCEADLYGANLHGANLCDADLRYVNFRCADLCGAELCGANLRYADFRGANLRGAVFYAADLRYADFRGANIRGVDFCGANFRGANLREVDFCGASLCGANLDHADLYGAKNVPYVPMVCPEEGEFIGWKKANGYLVKLLIPKDAKRSSATTRKCRCSKAKVLEIIRTKETQEETTKVASSYKDNFFYTLGEWVEVSNFDNDRWNECSAGIHFFMQKQEALDY